MKVRDIFPESVLLESSDFHGNENSLSYIALKPLASFGVNSYMSEMKYPDGKREEEKITDSFTVADSMNKFLSCFRITGTEADTCGLFGYTSFDAVKYFEKVPIMECHDDMNDAPDLLYILYRYIIVFNHFKNELTLIELLQEGEEDHLCELESILNNRNFASYDFRPEGAFLLWRRG